VLIGVPIIASLQQTAFADIWTDVPLTLRLGYVAALFLSIAHMLYEGFCPQVIKRFESPNDLYKDMLAIKALQHQYLAGDSAFVFDIGHCRRGFKAANLRNWGARLACGVLYAAGLVIVLWVIVERSAIVLGVGADGGA
jgi:hypothetical protein